MNDTYVLIMAGGEGTRFTPLSTPEKPKQFLSLVGEGSFLQQTVKRVSGIVPPKRMLVATNARYVDLVRDQLPEIVVENIIAETRKKNTAPCIAYAAKFIQERDPHAVMIVLPSDHVILEPSRFREVMEVGTRVAREMDRLVTIGIQPSRPATEYGYIKISSSSFVEFPVAHPIEAFVEKPDERDANRYIKDGCFYWNSGIFIWRASCLIAELATHLPEINKLLKEYSEGEKFRNEFFEKVEGMSIDYGVMEKTSRAAVIPCDLGWSDVGTWEGLYHLWLQREVNVDTTAQKYMRKALGYVKVDSTKQLPQRVEKPWGYEEIWAQTEEYVGKILFIRKSHRLSYQFHRVKNETIRVTEGEIQLECEERGSRRTISLSPGDVYHIPAGTRHRFVAIEDAKILEVSTPYLNDIVRIEDDYGRSE